MRELVGDVASGMGESAMRMGVVEASVRDACQVGLREVPSLDRTANRRRNQRHFCYFAQRTGRKAMLVAPLVCKGPPP
jgi:hypothetical protein